MEINTYTTPAFAGLNEIPTKTAPTTNPQSGTGPSDEVVLSSEAKELYEATVNFEDPAEDPNQNPPTLNGGSLDPIPHPGSGSGSGG